jgi:hypothetical protein
MWVATPKPPCNLHTGLARTRTNTPLCTYASCISGCSFQIESADPVERKWACVAVSNLIYNDPSARRLMQGKNVVGTLIGRLTDSEEEVVVEAAGALR